MQKNGGEMLVLEQNNFSMSFGNSRLQKTCQVRTRFQCISAAKFSPRLQFDPVEREAEDECD